MATQNININVNARGVKQTTRQMDGLNNSMKRSGVSAAAAAVAFGLLGGAVRRIGTSLVGASDEYTNLSNRTKVFSSSSQSAAYKMQDTINIARKMNTSLSEVGEVYQRISMVQEGVGMSDNQVTTMVGNLTKAVKLSGATAQEAEGALRQFSQGLAANRLSGQELNSVLEQTPFIAKLLADSLGVATGDLRAMGKAGELTTKVLIDTFGVAIDDLDNKFSKFTFNTEANIVSLKRELTLTSGQLMQVTGVTAGINSILQKAKGAFQSMAETLKKGGAGATVLKAAFGALIGTLTAFAILAGVGVASAIIAMLGPLGPFVIAATAAGVAVSAFAGALIALKNEDTISTLNAQIAEMTRFNDTMNKGSGATREHINALGALQRKRADLLKLQRDEASYETVAGPVNPNAELEFIGGDISGFGADPQFDMKIAEQRYLTEQKAVQELSDAKEVAAKLELKRLEKILSVTTFINNQRLEATKNGLSTANSAMAASGDNSGNLTADFNADSGALNAGISSPTSSSDDITAMEEALAVRTAMYDLEMADNERKVAGIALNEGLMTGSITLGEVTSGVTASMTEGFKRVAEEAFNISAGIQQIAVAGVRGLSDEISNLALTGEADFKKLGMAIVKMIMDLIIQMIIMMAIVAAITAMGGGALLQSIGLGAPGKASGGPINGPTIVGERGPELFVPPQSGSIKNTTETQGLMGNQQAPQVTVMNVDSMENTLDALGSRDGENLILNVMTRNKEVLR